ncbi:MAG: Gldg family protein [Candidatus Howiella sp.]
MSKKKSTEPVQKKLRSKFALKHGAYSIAFIAVAVAVFVVVNILATALVQRFPLNIDLTAGGDYSVSEKNIEYIKGVTRPVTITVCATEGDYATYMAQYASYYYSATDSTDGKYYTQAMTLLDEYTKYNSNIQVVYADPQSPEFSDIKARVGSSASLTYGSILVESSFELNGETVSRSKVLSFSDLYDVTDSTGGYAAYYGSGYELTGSKVESAVTSAIYSVTSDKTTEVAYITAHMSSSALDGLNTTLADNNYNVTAIDNLIGYEIDESVEVLMIASPTSDYSGAELEKLDAFLDNGGQRGKTLVFFGSSDSPDLPNLYAFLAEWGINCTPGSVYETETNNIYQTNYIYGMTSKKSDYTASTDSLSRIYLCGGNIPMSVGFESQGNRTTTEVMATSDTVTVRPLGAGEDWVPDNAAKQTLSSVIVSQDMVYGSNHEELKSHVLAFSSVDFVSDDWLSFTGTVGNMEMAIGVFNQLSGRDADSVTFTNKTISVESFSDQVTVLASNIIKILFVGIVPIAVIVVGIVIWSRRKNR